MYGEFQYYADPGRDYRNGIEIGNVYLAPVPFFLPPKLPKLSLIYKHPSDESKDEYKIETINVLQASQLKEFDLLQRFKFRPVIVIAASPYYEDFKREYGHCYICVPMYSRHPKDDGTFNFSDHFIRRVMGYQYPSLYYLPGDEGLCISESVGRFDRICAFHDGMLIPKRVKLTSVGLVYLQKWFFSYLGGPIDEAISIYHDDAVERIREIERPSYRRN